MNLVRSDSKIKDFTSISFQIEAKCNISTKERKKEIFKKEDFGFEIFEILMSFSCPAPSFDPAFNININNFMGEGAGPPKSIRRKLEERDNGPTALL